jgi:hypothetical protein
MPRGSEGERRPAARPPRPATWWRIAHLRYAARCNAARPARRRPAWRNLSQAHPWRKFRQGSKPSPPKFRYLDFPRSSAPSESHQRPARASWGVLGARRSLHHAANLAPLVGQMNWRPNLRRSVVIAFHQPHYVLHVETRRLTHQKL